MKSVRSLVIAVLIAASLLPPCVSAGENRSIAISSDSFAAIAYSPDTGKYGYAYDRRSRSAAEDGAMRDCGADDARIACWINKGFCALALGNDKSCWGWAGHTGTAPIAMALRITHSRIAETEQPAHTSLCP